MASWLLFRLPGPQRFIARLVEDLGERRSLLILLPDGVNPQDIWRTVCDELWRREFRVYEIHLPDIQGRYLPAAALGEKLGVRWPSPASSRTAANLAGMTSLPDVIWLGGVVGLPLDLRVSWLEFLGQWAQSSKNVIDRGGRPAAICLACPAWAFPAVPGESLHLSVRFWWGMPSALETRLLCRLGEEAAPNDGIAAGWREYVLPSLAGSDLSLAEWLWDDVYDGIDHLIDRLVRFARQRGWTREILMLSGEETWSNVSRVKSSSAAPGPEHFPLWGKGALSSTPEYGLELHTAVLPLIGRNEEVGQRLWRGQAPLLLPLLDDLRLGLCRYLTRHYGREWPVRWQVPQSHWETAEVRENPLACQWGHLEYLIRNCPALRAERRSLSFIALARSIRNRLAHFRAVDFKSYAALCGEADKADAVL